MVDPVFIGGKTYEREAIQEWLERSNLCPLTKKVLPNQNLEPNDDRRCEIFEFMATIIKKILDLLPKLMNKDHFPLAEDLLNHADKYNKTLKNDYSAMIIDSLIKVLPKLIKEEHYKFTENLLVRAED